MMLQQKIANKYSKIKLLKIIFKYIRTKGSEKFSQLTGHIRGNNLSLELEVVLEQHYVEI